MLEPPRSSPSAASPCSAFIACSPTPRSTSVKQRERWTKTLINAVGEARRWPLHQFLPCDSTTARVPSERLQTGSSPVCCAGAARAAGEADIAARAHAMAPARIELRISLCTDRPDHMWSEGRVGRAGTGARESAGEGKEG